MGEQREALITRTGGRYRLQSFTLGGVEDNYRWDEESYDRIAASGIPWQAVSAALRTHPRIRRHIGGDLTIAAPVPDWVTDKLVWIAVELIEEDDDQYLVYDARELDVDEINACQKMIEGDLP